MKRLLPFAGTVALVAAAWAAGALAPVERALMDARFALVQRPASDGVVVVAIDPASLRALDVWPWARGYHATVLENLLAAGARRVGFDVDFSSRSDADEDRELARALASAGADRVLLPTFQQQERSSTGHSWLAVTEPWSEFARHAGRATINIRPDPGGLVRRYRTWERIGDARVPSFAAALAGIDRPAADEFYLDFGIRVDTILRLSYVDVLTERFDPEAVRGRAVIVGATAVELSDSLAVPQEASLAGPLLQALAFESLVQDRTLLRSNPLLTVVVLTFLGLAGGPLLRALSWRGGLAVSAGAALLLVAASVITQALSPVLLETAPWMAVLAANFLLVVVMRIDHQQLSLLLQGLRLRRTETLMRHVVQHSFDAILTLDDRGRIQSANPAAATMFGYGLAEMRGRHVGELAFVGEPASITADTDAPWRATGGPRETLGRRSDGSSFPLEAAVRELDDDERGRLVCFLRDITERKAHEQELEHQATHDSLTGLPNRVLLRRRTDEALSEAERSGRPLALMILDLDRFKEINDTLGHHVGDQLLRQIGERLLEPLGKSEVMARFGGDEFAVLLPGADAQRAREVGSLLVEGLTRPFSLFGVSLHVEASVGIALYPEHGRGATELVQRADVAMYLAKRGRTDLAVYDPEQDFTSVRNLTLSGELRDAIERDELTLCYQPKVSCRGGRLVGVEALVRWRHPRHGLLAPAEFIAVAEHSGLIRPLSQWVLRAALRQCASWRARGLDIPVAVNLSARNLQEEELPQRLAELLEQLELPPGLVTLEITESVIMDNPQRALVIVTKFSDLGVNIAIDDFGTGYSSLAYLKRLPAREIKIDRAFVAEIDKDREDAVIVHSTIEMAHNLGLRVVAEGVETRAVWDRLCEFGCNTGQGYFFSAPLDPDQLIGWLEGSPWGALQAGGDSDEENVA